MIYGIWAEDEQGLIGQDGKLPWKLPAELQHFKKVTMGNIILMGRKTFDGMNKRVLPGRIALVLTREPSYEKDNASILVFHSKNEVLSWYQKQDKTLFITGGAEMFSLFEHELDGIYRTKINARFEGDAFFPSTFDWSAFKKITQEVHTKDEKNAYDFTIETYSKK